MVKPNESKKKKNKWNFSSSVYTAQGHTIRTDTLGNKIIKNFKL